MYNDNVGIIIISEFHGDFREHITVPLSIQGILFSIRTKFMKFYPNPYHSRDPIFNLLL